MHEMGARQTGDLLFEARRTNQFCQDVARVVKAQRLIEIRGKQVMSNGSLPASPWVRPWRHVLEITCLQQRVKTDGPAVSPVRRIGATSAAPYCRRESCSCG